MSDRSQVPDAPSSDEQVAADISNDSEVRLTEDPQVSEAAAKVIDRGRADQLDVGCWKVRAGNAIGTSHITEGTELQDHYLIATFGDYLVVTVADGAGSAKYSAVGAATATQVAIAVLTESLTAFEHTYGVESEPDIACLLVATIAAARNAVLALNMSEGGEKHNWATTLTVVFAGPTGVWVAKVGDGYVVKWSDDEAAHALAVPDEDKNPSLDESKVRYANETCFLTSSTALAKITVQHEALASGDRLLVTSDGIAPMILSKWLPPTVHAPFFDALSVSMDSGKFDDGGVMRFLLSDRVCGRTDDDKTMVLAEFRGEGFGTGLSGGGFASEKEGVEEIDPGCS